MLCPDFPNERLMYPDHAFFQYYFTVSVRLTKIFLTIFFLLNSQNIKKLHLLNLMDSLSKGLFFDQVQDRMCYQNL